MDPTFMNSENNETSELRRLMLNLSDKIHLKWSDKCIVLSNRFIYYTRRSINKLNKFTSCALNTVLKK